MSKHEKPLIDEYWEQIGGTIVYEFCMVRRAQTNAPRFLDALILPNQETKIAQSSEVELEGQDIILVQAKHSRIGMYLMGQALFSVALMEKFQPKSIRSIALCTKDDAILRPLLESHGVEVVVIAREKA